MIFLELFIIFLGPNKNNKVSIFNQVRNLFKLSSVGGFIALFLGVFLKSIIEIAGIASIAPFLSVVVNPEIIQSNAYLYSIYQYFEFTNTIDFLTYLGVFTLSLLLFTSLVSAIVEWQIIRFSKTMEYRLSSKLMEQYLSNSYAFFLENNSSSLGKNIISEVQRCIDGVIFPLLTAVSRGITVLLLIIFLIIFDPYVTMVMISLFGFSYTLIYLLVRKKLFLLGGLASKAMEGRFKTINESFLGIKEIKLHGYEDKFISKYKKYSQDQAYYYIYQHIMSTIPKYGLEFIAFGGIVLLMLYLVSQGEGAKNTIPIVALYAISGYKLMPALQNIYSSMVTLKFNIPALAILTNDLKRNNFHESCKKRQSPLVKFRNQLSVNSIDFSYSRSDKCVIKNLSMDIAANTTIGIVGSTGSGKTTLVDIVLGLLTPNLGEVCIDGIKLNQDNMSSWQRKIGYMPQNIFLIDDTISANICFGLAISEINFNKVKQAAKLANLHDFIINLPDKYNTIIGEQGIRLSGGQKQRVGLARALYNSPEVIVLDEGTSALDVLTESAVMSAIHNLSHQKTIILVAHRLSTIRDCDIIYLFENGNIEECGTYDELILDSEKFKKMSK
jgi:ABC-type bacteriocin/lantibiotic exporter with double-glycine peptidase domain